MGRKVMIHGAGPVTPAVPVAAETEDNPTVTLRTVSDLTEEVSCSIQPVMFPLLCGRPSLLKLYHPSEPVPPEQATQLVNIIRVLSETNQKLRLYAAECQAQVKAVHGAVLGVRTPVSEAVHRLEAAVRDYKPSIHPESD